MYVIIDHALTIQVITFTPGIYWGFFQTPDKRKTNTSGGKMFTQVHTVLSDVCTVQNSALTWKQTSVPYQNLMFVSFTRILGLNKSLATLPLNLICIRPCNQTKQPVRKLICMQDKPQRESADHPQEMGFCLVYHPVTIALIIKRCAVDLSAPGYWPSPAVSLQAVWQTLRPAGPHGSAGRAPPGLVAPAPLSFSLSAAS